MHSGDSTNEADYGKIIAAIMAGDSRLTLDDIHTKMYDQLRKHKYPPDPRNEPSIDEFAAESGFREEITIVTVKDSEHNAGWIQRQHVDLDKSLERTVARVSVNAFAEMELLDKLDAFCADHKLSYKVPDCVERWENRHDTVTIYFREPPERQLLEELAALVAPHIRGECLIGKKIETCPPSAQTPDPPGIYYSQEPTDKDIRALIARGKTTIGPAFGEWIQKKAERRCGDNRVDLFAMFQMTKDMTEDEAKDYMLKGERPMNWQVSLGEVAAITRMIDAYELYKQQEQAMPEGNRRKRWQERLAGLKKLSPAERTQAQALADNMRCESYKDIPAALEGLSIAAGYFDAHDPTGLPAYFRQTEAKFLADAKNTEGENSSYSKVGAIMADAFGTEGQTQLAGLAQRLAKMRQALETIQRFSAQEEPNGFSPDDIEKRNAYIAQGRAAVEVLNVVMVEAHDVEAYLHRLNGGIERKLDESAQHRSPDWQIQDEAVIQTAKRVLGLEGFEQEKRDMLIDMPFAQTLATLRTATTRVPHIARGVGELASHLHEQLSKRFPDVSPG